MQQGSCIFGRVNTDTLRALENRLTPRFHSRWAALTYFIVKYNKQLFIVSSLGVLRHLKKIATYERLLCARLLLKFYHTSLNRTLS